MHERISLKSSHCCCVSQFLLNHRGISEAITSALQLLKLDGELCHENWQMESSGATESAQRRQKPRRVIFNVNNIRSSPFYENSRFSRIIALRSWLSPGLVPVTVAIAYLCQRTKKVKFYYLQLCRILLWKSALKTKWTIVVTVWNDLFHIWNHSSFEQQWQLKRDILGKGSHEELVLWKLYF